MPSVRVLRLSRGLLTATAALCALSLLRTVLHVGGASTAEAIYDAGMFSACASWCLRIVVREDPARGAFVCAVAGTVLWSAGSVVTAIEGNGPGFSLADLLMAGVQPLLCVGVAWYGATALPRPITTVRAVDAVLTALTVGAVGAAFVVEGALAAHNGATTAALYPAGAVALTAIVVALLALRGWAFDARLSLLLAGAATLALTEFLYRRAQAGGDVAQFGTLYDVGWMAGTLLIAIAAWSAQRPVPAGPRRAEVVVPVVMGAAALAVLVVQAARSSVSPLTITLSGLAVAVLLARMALSLTANHRLLISSLRDATTDPVTGLGNHRSLHDDLGRLGGAPATLVLFDLNGFKAYNDNFGHLAGDHLLARIGGALQQAVGPNGRAYRMGGDEFCALLPGGSDLGPATLAERIAQRGEGFAVTAAFGAVELPSEAREPAEALRLADERMYIDKRSAESRGRPVVDVLLELLDQQDAQLRRHAEVVANLADRTAVALGLDEPARRDIRHAAALHDIGKVALPTDLLDKAGPLDGAERAFVERHTLIGERVVAAAAELRGAAALVRASHERWDGRGYPDGLAGEAIPLGARVIFVCHAYDAMTSVRPHAIRVTHDEALAALRREAGTAFDPAVVEAFATIAEAAAAHDEDVRLAER